MKMRLDAILGIVLGVGLLFWAKTSLPAAEPSAFTSRMDAPAEPWMYVAVPVVVFLLLSPKLGSKGGCTGGLWALVAGVAGVLILAYALGVTP